LNSEQGMLNFEVRMVTCGTSREPPLRSWISDPHRAGWVKRTKEKKNPHRAGWGLNITCQNLLIFFSPGGVNYAQESQIGISCVFDILERLRRDVNSTIRTDFERFFIYMHQALSGYYVVNFGGLEFMWFGCLADSDLRVG